VSPVLRRLREELGDRYVVERELGKGGMATVFLARDVKHDREVAIKVLHPDLSASIGAERFEREIKLAAKLQHPHILGLYDSGAADGLLYYVMPFVRGESLRDRIDREGMLPIDDAVRIALQVADALGYAHANGIVHRDIKPENILLSGEHILVADFGIARAASEAGQQKLTQTGMAVGTPVYMAPEQSTGDEVGPAADIYSLGCMLYEMLSGEPPFTGPNAMAIMAKHLMEQVPSVRVVRQAVPVEIEQAIFITLNKQPIDRPQNAQQFADLLGMPLGATGTMRVMRGSTAMRGSQMVRGSTIARQSQFGLQGIPDAMLLPAVPVWKRPVAWVGVTAAAAAGLFFALNGAPTAPANDPDARRVAVLYFQDASRDSSLRPVADGLTEGLIRTLGRVSTLEVISRGGVEPYRGATVGVDSIARALRAAYVVHGSLAPENARVRVSLTLSRRTGVPVSDSSFTVARDSVVLAQEAISGAASELIRGAIGVQIALQDQRARTASNAAWIAAQDGAQLLRRAQALQAARDTTGAAQAAFESADSSFARAEALDRRWSEPVTRRAALAYQRSRLAGTDPAAIRPWVALAIGHADRAIALDPEDPDALEMRGTARYWGVISGLHVDESTRMRELRAAQQDLEGAVDLNPRQAGAYTTLSHMYYRLPDKTNDNVLTAAAKALDADEFQANVVAIRQRLFNAAFDLGRFDAAEQYCAELERRFAGNARALRCRLYLQSIPTRFHADSVDVDRAWRLADSLAATAPGDTKTLLTGHMWVAAALARKSVGTGLTPSAARTLADSARALAKRSEGDAVIDSPRDLAYFGAYVYSVLGNKQDAIRLLDAYIVTDPATHQASLRADPTWMFRRLAEDPGSGFARAVGAPR
jgi:eukaryotic-like serine/threonine-protein kinase